ncbi:hypothetical protein [Saccharolobus shibatae]|uniref:hypothetical protein n=1 Tax=Saccharolobus shibatae TaxID=2286 RepID=UPI001C45117B|nr:hypothetical protein [Saccharolobus shibatae]
MATDPQQVNDVIRKMDANNIGPVHRNGNLAKAVVDEEKFLDFGVGKMLKV